MSKIRLAIIYGGKSSEHEVSKMSARNVIDAVSKDTYDVTEVFISLEGEWFIHDKAIEPLTKLKDFDVVFPVMHGQYGEDGTMQGLLKLADVAFVGSSVLGSAAGMDKDVMKRLCQQAGIPVAPGIVLRRGDVIDMKKVEADFKYPMFVKPANMGSSVGVHKAGSRDEFAAAITDAFLYDTKVLIEAAIVGQEVETAVLGNEDPQASLPGIVRAKGHDFYDYESKYEDDDGYELEIPAQLQDDMLKKVQETAINVFKVCECEGLSRVDSFVTETGEVIVNEINTIPGFTNISMYPKLWEASGIGYSELIDKLIQFAIERYKRDSSLKTTK
jgi:D-alanine-D-alanine ligase